MTGNEADRAFDDFEIETLCVGLDDRDGPEVVAGT